MEDKPNRPYKVLCAIEMLIDNGKPGFFHAVFNILSRQQQSEPLDLHNPRIAIETRLEVARYVKAGFRDF